MLTASWSVSLGWPLSTEALSLLGRYLTGFWHLQHLGVSNTIQASLSQPHIWLLWASLQGLPCHTPGLRLFLTAEEGFHNSFTPVSPRTLRSELPGQCCQVQPLELEPVPFLNYICITFSLLQLFSSRKFPKAFPFYSRISCGWGLALRTALPLFHFASDLRPHLIFQYKHQIFVVFFSSSNCTFCLSFCPTCYFSL